MQEGTPQNLPTPQGAPTPPSQNDHGGDLYQPAAPAQYAATAQAAPVAHPAPHTGPDTISWQASEYVHNDKGGMWIAGLVIITLIFAGVAFYLQAWTFLVLVVIMGVAMGVFAFRPPHTLSYTLNDNGVHIGEKTFSYSDFRAFGILEDGAFFTLTLIPVKRFAPAVNVYFAEEQGEDIVDIVGAHLPMEHIEPDIIDTIMHRLRF